jgi:rubrerythrin
MPLLSWEESPWSFVSFPIEMDLKRIFRMQLEKEKLALKLHQQIIGMITDFSIRDEFIGLPKEEELHIKIVEKILTRLS